MGFTMASKKKASDKKDSTKQERRSNVDRRQFSYTDYIPERRSNEDRRKREKEENSRE